VFWLRNILGTRHGDERDRPNPFTAEAQEAREAQKMRDKAGKPGSPVPALGIDGTPLEPGLSPELDKNMTITDTAEQGLLAIARADRTFEALGFLRGAQDAFVMIVEAFARGDRDTLKPLLAESVFMAFAGAITERETTGQKASVEIHAIRKAEIVSARLERRDAFITVRFVADETNVLRDSTDMLLHGNPDRITETIDIWTFVRDTKSREPGWLLIETSDEDAAQQDHKTVPDA